MSELLRSLTKNERMSESLVFLRELLIRSFLGKKTSDSLGKPMSEFPVLVWIRNTACMPTQNPDSGVRMMLVYLQIDTWIPDHPNTGRKLVEFS